MIVMKDSNVSDNEVDENSNMYLSEDSDKHLVAQTDINDDDSDRLKDTPITYQDIRNKSERGTNKKICSDKHKRTTCIHDIDMKVSDSIIG